MSIADFADRRQRRRAMALVLGVLSYLLALSSTPGLAALAPPPLPAPPVLPPFNPLSIAPYIDNQPTYYVSVEPSPTMDADLQASIRAQLARDPLLRAVGIQVTVQNGVAILSGSTDTWQNYTRAEADAYAAGARAVDNRLRVLFG
jgi:BON domain-containing protein